MWLSLFSDIRRWNGLCLTTPVLNNQESACTVPPPKSVTSLILKCEMWRNSLNRYVNIWKFSSHSGTASCSASTPNPQTNMSVKGYAKAPVPAGNASLCPFSQMQFLSLFRQTKKGPLPIYSEQWFYLYWLFAKGNHVHESGISPG